MESFLCTQISVQNQRIRIRILVELKKCEKNILAKKKKTFIEMFPAILKMENIRVNIFLYSFAEIKYLKRNLIFKASEQKVLSEPLGFDFHLLFEKT